MKKKLFALLMALVMVLSLAACGGDKGGDSQQSGDSQSSGDTQQPAEGGDAATTDLKLGYDRKPASAFTAPTMTSGAT